MDSWRGLRSAPDTGRFPHAPGGYARAIVTGPAETSRSASPSILSTNKAAQRVMKEVQLCIGSGGGWFLTVSVHLEMKHVGNLKTGPIVQHQISANDYVHIVRRRRKHYL